MGRRRRAATPAAAAMAVPTRMAVPATAALSPRTPMAGTAKAASAAACPATMAARAIAGWTSTTMTMGTSIKTVTDRPSTGLLSRRDRFDPDLSGARDATVAASLGGDDVIVPGIEGRRADAFRREQKIQFRRRHAGG